VVQVLEILVSLKQAGKTLIVLTHELEKVLALADRLIILHQGSIRDDGDPTEVLDRMDRAWGVRDPRRNYQNTGDCSWLDHSRLDRSQQDCSRLDRSRLAQGEKTGEDLMPAGGPGINES
jgi:ABC-type multidrug transport system ATPase subunit